MNANSGSFEFGQNVVNPNATMLNANGSISLLGVNDSFYMQHGNKMLQVSMSPQHPMSVTKNNSSKWLPKVQQSTEKRKEGSLVVGNGRNHGNNSSLQKYNHQHQHVIKN